MTSQAQQAICLALLGAERTRKGHKQTQDWSRHSFCGEKYREHNGHKVYKSSTCQEKCWRPLLSFPVGFEFTMVQCINVGGIYFSAQILFFQMCRLPMPDALMHPHTISETGCALTVKMVFFLLVWKLCFAKIISNVFVILYVGCNAWIETQTTSHLFTQRGRL